MLLYGARGGGLGVSLEGLVPHCRVWVGVGGKGHEAQPKGGTGPERRYNVGFQSQTQTYCSELEDPKGPAGAQ